MRTNTIARHGVWVSTLTGFRRGAVDPDLMGQHGRWLVSHGIRGLCPTGLAGEFPYLTPAEKLAIYEELTAVCSGRAAFWPYVWEPHEEAILDAARWLAPHDVTGVLIPPPLVYRFADEDIVWYYRRLADVSPLPIIAVSLPAQTQTRLSLEVIRALVVEGLVTGILDSTDDPRRLDELVEHFGGQIDVLYYGDALLAEGRARGLNGCVSDVANVFPELAKQVWDTGDRDGQALLDRVSATVGRTGGISALKYLLLRRGYRFGTRPPFGRLTPPQQQALDNLFSVVASEGFAEAVRLR